VNTGIADDPNETAAHGVFFNHDAQLPPQQNQVQIRVRTDRIPDGAHRTIAASENVQAVAWMMFPKNVPPPDVAEDAVGIRWSDSPGECGRINQCLKNNPPLPRPSSMHPGGVNILYCDGHVEFQADNIDYLIYQHLMTPDSAKAGLPPEPTSP